MNVDILLRGWHYAPAHVKEEGMDWYNTAHAICCQIAEDYTTPLSVVCGVTSALSPGLNWDSNLVCTARVLEHAAQFKTPKPSLFSDFSGYRTSMFKAWAIAKSTLTLPDCFSERNAPKTRSFFFNLLDPLDTDHVTIDRHAAAVFLELPRTRPVAIRYKRYQEFASLYKEAAQQLCVLPNQLQATLWILQRSGWQLTLF